MKQIAIVTGASSGLGKEFVRQIAASGERYEEIWVIARREDKLRELAAGISATVRPVPLDLASDDSFTALKALLEAEKPNVRLLINAAGFAKMGNYDQIASADNDGMIDLNCKALVRTTVIVLPYMKKGARILEISSSSAFQPLPGLGVYAASKAFVLRYSRALWWELIGRGINVTAVCPYWVKGTEFIGKSKQGANAAAVKHFPLASRPYSVVKWALVDSRLGLPVSTPSPVALAQRFFAKFVPHIIIEAAWEGLRRV